MASIQQYDPTVVSHSIYIVCVLYETISTVLVSEVKPPYQTMLAISTESVPVQLLSCVSPPTTMSSSCGKTATKHQYREVVMWLMTSQELVVVLYM